MKTKWLENSEDVRPVTLWSENDKKNRGSKLMKEQVFMSGIKNEDKELLDSVQFEDIWMYLNMYKKFNPSSLYKVYLSDVYLWL